MQHHDSRFRWGVVYAVCAHVLWGLFPIFWKMLGGVSAFALVAHRVLWAFMFLAILVPILIRTGHEVSYEKFRETIRSKKAWFAYSVAGLMLAINWVAFIWAVTHDQILQASLGYYINPLLSVLLGVVVLGERLRWLQWSAVTVAAIGVTIMTVKGGGLPLASIAMATSFSTYGLIKKRSPLPALSGLWLECTVLLIPAFLWLILTSPDDGKVNFPTSPTLWLLLLIGGTLTILPLALFAASTKRIPLSTVGVLQYIGPTLQFLTGFVVYGEPFDGGRFVGFIFVWIGSLIYLSTLVRRTPKLVPEPV